MRLLAAFERPHPLPNVQRHRFAPHGRQTWRRLTIATPRFSAPNAQTQISAGWLGVVLPFFNDPDYRDHPVIVPPRT